jgi:hypothetical protein
MFIDYNNRMLTDYENKRMKEDFEEKEEEAIADKKSKIMIEVDGKRYGSFADRGSIVKFRDGSEYRVAEDGSLRRVES